MGEVNCPRAGKWIGGCRFEGRYSSGAPMKVSGWGQLSESYTALLEASKPKTYVRDVCVRCGRTIERLSAPEPTP